MVLVSIIVTLIRVLVPLTILRFPLLGGILAMLADASDIMIFEKFGGDFFGIPYHEADKVLDIYYLFLEFLVARKWKNKLAGKTAKGLFYWRFSGFILFEITKWRGFFFLAPNIFEFFYLVYLIILKAKPKFELTKKKLLVMLLLIGIPNIVKEYIMHFLEFGTWAFLRDNLFWWLYNK